MATRSAIADTGPLVAFLDRREQSHQEIVARFKELEAPVLVCEPVLTEAAFLLRRSPPAQDHLLAMLEAGALRIAFSLDQEREAVRAFCRKYANLPMSLADACVVRMAELYDDYAVFTLDAHFAAYRKHGDQNIPLVVREPAGY